MPRMTTAIDAAIAHAEADWPATIERLAALVRIPSCSFPGFDPAHVAASAEATAAWLRDAGFPEVAVHSGGGPHPAVIARDRRAGPGAPTLLLYAHHDVQPPLREHLWRSPPHEPVVRDGRLWGRGAADDKAGIMVHAAAAAAWNATAGRPPLNLAVVIEGEEEIGSPHFPSFLRAHRDELPADALVIADAGNYAAGLPSLTVSLRGHLVVEVELAALRAPLHSGL
jgi:acetylornithine deacetylase/succinyl-diaminopimelate desuccinylase-like protein